MFKIGKNFHVIHMTDDLQELDAWYDDVFSVNRYAAPSYMEAEKRVASLTLIGELCVEPLAPAFHVEGWDNMPLGRFYQRFGKRWHSIAWFVDTREDLAELYQALTAAGIRMYGTGGVSQGGDGPVGALFTHPRDTYTQLEFVPSGGRPKATSPAEYASGMGLTDPRSRPGFNPAWWSEHHPLGIVNSSHVTIAVHDVNEARDLYVDVLGGELLYEGEIELTRTKSAFVAVGADLIIELANPYDASSAMATDMDAHRESMYCVTYKVRDLAAAEVHLRAKGIVAASNDGTTLLTDPATTQGVVMGFTTWDIPNDRRTNWAVYPTSP